MQKLKILTNKYLSNYKKDIWDLKQIFEKFLVDSKDLDFKYLTETSSIFSSRIEGNSLDLNSFMNFLCGIYIMKHEIKVHNFVLQRFDYFCIDHYNKL